MDSVVVLGDFTPPQKRCIARALNGQTSNKEQAQAEQVSTHAIARRWERIADAMQLPWGRRTRQHTLAELCRRHLVEFLCLVLIMLPAFIALNGADNIDMRTRRGGRSRRNSRDTTAALDIDTIGEITDWPDWLTNNNPSHRGEHLPGEAAITTAPTPIASIAMGATTGIAVYIASSWPGAGHTATEIGAELAGCAVGLLTHRRAKF
jgi:hypothetical protein